METYSFQKAAHIKRLTNEISAIPTFILTALSGISSSLRPAYTNVLFESALSAAEEAALDDIMDRHEARILLQLVSDAPEDEDGTPRVDSDGAATHTLTIRKVTPEGDRIEIGGETLAAHVVGYAVISDLSPTLVNGTATIVIGPSSVPTGCIIRVTDENGYLETGSIELRFCS